MTITKTFASKFAVAIVAAAMALSAFGPAAQAQTTDELQQMINDLLAQVASLQGQLGQGGTSVASGVCPYTWTRDLSSGSTGADVMKLQQFLNADPDTRVAASGAGSVGAETEYYGPATAAAVSKFQVKYRSDILSPVNLVNPTAFFGPSSRAKANSLCVASMDDTMDDDIIDVIIDDMDDTMDDDDDSSFSLSGEADLDSFELDSGESSVEEGDEDVEIGEITVEFQDGDAEISRLDLALVGDDGTPNDELEPWDVFESISLWVDGDKIAEEEIDDEDNYLDEDEGSVRFSGLDLIAEEDEEVEIIVAVSLQNNLDGVSDGETWQLFAQAMRFFDADGVATTEESQGDLVGDAPAFDDTDNVEFDIEEEGVDEELDISLGSSNPESTDIVVDTDSDTDDVTILVAELEAQDNDLEVNTIIVKVETTGASTSDVVNDIRVVIDGEEFDAENLVSTNKGTISQSQSRYVNNDVTDDAVWYVFDIDGDIVLDEDEEVDMEVVVDFDDTDDGARYDNGTLIKASITSVETDEWDVEGDDDLDNGDYSGTAVGDEHTLVAEGILLPRDGVEVSTDTSGDNDTLGEFTIEFEVTAVEGDFYITDNAALASTSPADGLEFTLEGPAAGVVDATVNASLSSTGDEDTSGVFTVREGETETFTLLVTVDPDTSGNYRVTLDSVFYSTNTNGTTGAVEYTATPAQDFRTGYETIQAS